jgi:hypothetical protein
VVLAARGTRNMDTGEEAVEDESECAAIRQQARKVIIESAILAAAATIVALAIR